MSYINQNNNQMYPQNPVAGNTYGGAGAGAGVPNNPYAQPGVPNNPYAQAQQGVQQYQNGNPQGSQKPNTTINVITDTFRTISLFEFSGAFDPAEQYPDGFAFVTGVVGVKDDSKSSGRRYDAKIGKISMKFSTLEIRSLGQALINLATFKAGATPYEKHSDPSKTSYNSNAAPKKLSAVYEAQRNNIAIYMKQDKISIVVPVPLNEALGLGHSLINVGNYTDNELAAYLRAHQIKREQPKEAFVSEEISNSYDQNVGYQQPNQPVQQNPQYQPNQQMQQQQPNPQYQPNQQYQG